MKLVELAEKKIHLFDTKVDRSGDCWIWTGNKSTTTGYGLINTGPRVKQKKYRAHRVSYALYFGDFDESLLVLHTCDNRLCVKPDHLFLGTNDDNMKDMRFKGRATWGDKSSHAKFTNEQVLNIRSRYEAGETQSSLREEFAVSKSTMSYIVNNITYKNI